MGKIHSSCTVALQSPLGFLAPNDRKRQKRFPQIIVGILDVSEVRNGNKAGLVELRRTCVGQRGWDNNWGQKIRVLLKPLGDLSEYRMEQDSEEKFPEF